MLGFHTAWPDPSFFLFSLKSLFSSHLSLSFFIQHRALTLSPSCCCVFHPFVYFLQMFLSYLNLNPLLSIFSLASILYLTLLSFISVVRRLHCYESYICQSLTSLSLCCSPVTTKIRLQVIVSTWRDQLPLIAFGGRVTFDRVARERECHGEIMTLLQTYGDRMGTTNHDMECIKESFFLQTLSTTLSSIR